MPITKRPWTRIVAEDKVEMRRMYEDGRSIREISEYLGIPSGSIHQSLRRAGVEMRPAYRRPKKVTA